MVGEIVNNIRAVLILILGLLIGLAFGVLGPVVGLGLVAVITAYIMIVSSPDVAICVLTGYAVIDWVLRLVAGRALSCSPYFNLDIQVDKC